jgi:uncharacterized protein YecE (DUF72 family)
MAAGDFLAYYRERFDTVEVNNTFYQLPEAETLGGWRRAVGADFLFAVKASRYITHMKKLKDPREPIETFLTRVEALEGTLGPILFQLPPNWSLDASRLRAFVERLPDRRRYAFEFRDSSWLVEEAYAILRAHNVALCINDYPGLPEVRELTADFVYVRLHGTQGAYEGGYPTQDLAGWAGAFSTWRSMGQEIYCYFNNDQAGHAVRDARRLREMLDQRARDERRRQNANHGRAHDGEGTTVGAR